MFELFSDLHSSRDNRLTRLDVRIKLGILAVFMAAILFARTPSAPMFFFALAVGMMFHLRLPVKIISVRFVAPLAMAIMALTLQSLLTGSRPLYGADVFGVNIVFTEEGTHSGFLVASRILGAASVFILFTFIAPAHRVFQALRSIGVPAAWVEIALLTYRNSFVLLDTASEMYDAQKVRLGFSGARRGLASSGTLAGAVIVRSLEKADRTFEAMRARGYDGTIPHTPLAPMLAADYFILALVSGIAATAFFLMEGGI